MMRTWVLMLATTALVGSAVIPVEAGPFGVFGPPGYLASYRAANLQARAMQLSAVSEYRAAYWGGFASPISYSVGYAPLGTGAACCGTTSYYAPAYSYAYSPISYAPACCGCSGSGCGPGGCSSGDCASGGCNSGLAVSPASSTSGSAGQPTPATSTFRKEEVPPGTTPPGTNGGAGAQDPGAFQLPEQNPASNAPGWPGTTYNEFNQPRNGGSGEMTTIRSNKVPAPLELPDQPAAAGTDAVAPAAKSEAAEGVTTPPAETPAAMPETGAGTQRELIAPSGVSVVSTPVWRSAETSRVVRRARFGIPTVARDARSETVFAMTVPNRSNSVVAARE